MGLLAGGDVRQSAWPKPSLRPGDELLTEFLPRNDLRRAGERPHAPEGVGGIQLSRVTKQFLPDQPPAVNDFTLSIAEGEFMVLVGESGAGKSTVLRR